MILLRCFNVLFLISRHDPEHLTRVRFLQSEPFSHQLPGRFPLNLLPHLSSRPNEPGFSVVPCLDFGSRLEMVLGPPLVCWRSLQVSVSEEKGMSLPLKRPSPCLHTRAAVLCALRAPSCHFPRNAALLLAVAVIPQAHLSPGAFDFELRR